MYQKAIEPVQSLQLHGDDVTVINRYDFKTLDHLRCFWSVVSAGEPRGPETEVAIPLGIKPHTEAQLHITGLPKEFRAESYLNLRFTLKEETAWAKAGHQIAWGQLALSEPSHTAIPKPAPQSEAKAKIEQSSPTMLTITSASGASTWGIDLVRGVLVSWVREKTELMAQPLVMDLWRATIEPDRRSHGVQWLQRRVDQTRYTTRKVEWSERDGEVTIRTEGRVAPPVQAWGIALTTEYIVRQDTMTIKVRGQPGGPNLPDTLPRIGLSGAFNGVNGAKWWGRGPGESYADKKVNQAFGNWESTIDDLWVEYEEPQESGNRTDVRYVEFLGDVTGGQASSLPLFKVNFGVQPGCSFAASHYTATDVAQARHPYELRKKKREETFIRLDWAHQGTGSGLIETGTVEEKYKLIASNPFEFELELN